MKRFLLLSLICATVIVFSYCNTTKKAVATVPAVSYTYDQDVQHLIQANCTPCHIPAKGGRKESLDNYDAVKANIDDVIRRIDLNPGEPGFMPFKHPKLSDSTIRIFKDWKSGGMLRSK
jgi:hypothetical protein